jgi:hypothetical protein
MPRNPVICPDDSSIDLDMIGTIGNGQAYIRHDTGEFDAVSQQVGEDLPGVSQVRLVIGFRQEVFQ